MRHKRLSIVRAPHENAQILDFDRAPCFKGDEDEKLLCGGCSAVLADGVSETSLSRQLAAPVQLLVKCPECQVYNLLPAQWVPENAAFG